MKRDKTETGSEAKAFIVKEQGRERGWGMKWPRGESGER